MKIIIDDKIPYIKGEFERWADVEYLSSQEITADSIREAEVLVVRTRTLCNASLLHGSDIKIIATATIGRDHIDEEWCKSHEIKVISAPGCNAPAVGEWVNDALKYWAKKNQINLSKEKIAIIGYGHVGHEVEKKALSLGMAVELIDPYVEGCRSCVEEVIEQCTVVTYHVPLNKSTYHLCNDETLKSMNRHGLLINAARGGVVDEVALLNWLRNNPEANAAIDCWEGEPDINKELAKRVLIGTPHIAGYSVEGKWQGTRMVVEAIKQHYGWKWEIEEASREFLNKTEDFEKLRKTR